jgi:ribonucleoside-diphosphate reductase alpha chain
MAKEGSTISGLMDGFATAISFALQYGVPLQFLVDKFSHVRFEPSGWTGNDKIPYAKSLLDYIFRWMGGKFLGPEYALGEAGDTPKLRPTEPELQPKLPFSPIADDAPACSECGSIMTRKRLLLQVQQLRRDQRMLLSGYPGTISAGCCHPELTASG